MTEEVQIAKEDGVLRLQFNRPEKKNAFTPAMYAAINDAMEAGDKDDAVRCLLFEGNGGSFTSGNDLSDFMDSPPTEIKSSPVFRFLLNLVHFSKPIVASVDGVAVGVGSTMLLHCDAVYCSERAKFSFPFINLGLVPEAASSVLLAARVGPTRAHEWLLFGESISAEEAEKAGLVTKVVPHDALIGFARGRATTLAQKPPHAMHVSKDLLRVGEKQRTVDAMEREAAHFLERLTSAEAKQAFAAFFARKK